MAQMLGEERVGASVVFRNGRSSNKEYRKYRVKTDAKDDLRMMSEVILRWMKRQDEWPDLLLLDGGKTHLTTIVKVLENNSTIIVVDNKGDTKGYITSKELALSLSKTGYNETSKTT